MRARFLALAAALLTASACRTSAPADSAPHSPPPFSARERFEDVKKLWEDARRARIAKLDEQSARERSGEKPVPGVPLYDPGVGLPEFLMLYAECAGLAAEVPEALQFCIDVSGDVGLQFWPLLQVPGSETLCDVVRAAPDSESVDKCVWRLWNGSQPEGSSRYRYLGALSKLSDLPRGSLARGWARMAKAVWVHGIGAPDALVHDPKLALDALDGLEADFPGTAVARHAHALRRTVLAFDSAAPAPALNLVDIEGQPLNLSALRQPCALLLFWDPADPASQEVLDKIQLLGVRADLLGVQVGGDAADVARLLRGHKIPFRTAIVAGWKDPVLQDWGVFALPASFLVDKEHHVRAIDQFGDALNRTVKTLREQTFVGAVAR